MSVFDRIKDKASKFNVDEMFDDFFGTEEENAQKAAKAADKEEVLNELRMLTTDETDDDIVLRAMKVYRSAVLHTKAGGTVQFVGPNGSRTLKVRLR